MVSSNQPNSNQGIDHMLHIFLLERSYTYRLSLEGSGKSKLFGLKSQVHSYSKVSWK